MRSPGAGGDLDALVANDGDKKVLLNDGTSSVTDDPKPPGFTVFSRVALRDLDGDCDQPAVYENGLINIDPDGLLPDINVDMPT